MKTPESIAAKLADDLRSRWGLRKRGDRSKLRPDEAKIMEAQERDIDRLIARGIRSALNLRQD